MFIYFIHSVKYCNRLENRIKKKCTIFESLKLNMTISICSTSIPEIRLFRKMIFTFSPPFCHSFRFVGDNALFSTEDYRCPGHGATDPVLPKAMTFTSALSGTVIVLMKWKKEMRKL